MFDGLPPAKPSWHTPAETALTGDNSSEVTLQLPTSGGQAATIGTRPSTSWAHKDYQYAPGPGSASAPSPQQAKPERVETTLGSVGVEAPVRRRRGAHAKPKERGLLVAWKRVLPRKVRDFLFN